MYASVSSTYLFQVVICVDTFGITFLSKSTINIPTITGQKSGPLQRHPFEYTVYYRKKNIHFWYKVAKDLSFFWYLCFWS